MGGICFVGLPVSEQHSVTLQLRPQVAYYTQSHGDFGSGAQGVSSKVLAKKGFDSDTQCVHLGPQRLWFHYMVSIWACDHRHRF